MSEVAIVGVGIEGFRPETKELSWKELMYAAATKAYADADLSPRSDVQSFITCAEDYWEGFSIFDEFVPDQLGAVLKPTCTVSGDGIQGLGAAYMQLQSGLFDVVALEAHSKASDILTYDGILRFAFDPVFLRPLGFHPHLLAGLDMAAYLRRNGSTEAQVAGVVAKNRANARLNPRAAYGADTSAAKVLQSEALFDPLRREEVARLADGCVVLVLGARDRARAGRHPVWLRGIAWDSDSPWVTTREAGTAPFVERAARRAYAMAGIRSPQREVGLAEVDDRFAYRELLHLEALGLAPPRRTGKLLENGTFNRDGDLPVNASGGSLGVGDLLEANGLMRVAEVALQLRGEAGGHQVKAPAVGVAQSWRGFPTATGGVAVLGVG